MKTPEQELDEIKTALDSAGIPQGNELDEQYDQSQRAGITVGFLKQAWTQLDAYRIKKEDI